MKNKGNTNDRFDKWATRAGILKEGQRTSPADGYVATQVGVNFADKLEEKAGLPSTKGRRSRLRSHPRAVGGGPSWGDMMGTKTIYEKAPATAAPDKQETKAEQSPAAQPQQPPTPAANRQSTPQEEEALARTTTYASGNSASSNSGPQEPSSPDRLIGGLIPEAKDMLFTQVPSAIRRYTQEAQRNSGNFDQAAGETARRAPLAPAPMSPKEIGKLHEQATKDAGKLFDKHYKNFYKV